MGTETLRKDELSFRVADVEFKLSFFGIDNPRFLLPSYAPFYLERGDSQSLVMSMDVAPNQLDFTPEGEELGQFDCGDINHGVYRRLDGGYKILISNIKGEPACAFCASEDFSQCKVSLFGDRENCRFGLNNAIMIAFAFAGAYHGILLMHASVTMYDGKGYLFLGKSGTGKSTHSSLWIKHIYVADLLNDDNPAVRVLEDGSVWVYGTPWSGKTPCYRNQKVKAGAFVRLEQYPENIIKRNRKLEAFASVLSSCSTMIWDKPSYDAIIDNISKIIPNIPAYYMKCRPDREAALLCNKIITHE